MFYRVMQSYFCQRFLKASALLMQKTNLMWYLGNYLITAINGYDYG